MRLDAHQHFWQLANPFTNWPTPDLPALYRDFSPEDLRTILRDNGIDGTILVQAAPSIDETLFCLSLAHDQAFIKGVVGWIDFESPDAGSQLKQISQNTLLKGLRPMVQSIEEEGWLLRSEFTPIFEAMAEAGLSLDGLVLSHQIEDLDALARRHPDLKIVLDHAGKPAIAAKTFDPKWAAAISSLAKNQNVHCKLSGLWTEAGDDISQANIGIWVDHLFATFGTSRLMWGSDWPVVNLAGEYQAWLQQCEAVLANLSEAERSAVLGDNAARFYNVAS